METEKFVIHMKLDRETVRLIDYYAAEHNLYRNEAAAQLLKLATTGVPTTATRTGQRTQVDDCGDEYRSPTGGAKPEKEGQV